MGHLLADAAGAGDPVRAEPGGHEEPANLALAEDELVVRRERLGAVDHPGHAGVLDRRDARDRAPHDRLEARPVRIEQAVVEVSRDAVERPGHRVALVAAHAQPADLLAEVAQPIRVAHRRQVGHGALDRVREQVLVGHRDDRDGYARHPPDLRREHPAGVDDDLGLDRLALAALGPRPRRRVTRPRATLMPTTRVCWRIVAPRERAPAASACASPDGSSQPSVGSQTAPRTPSSDISGNFACASSGVISSSGSPNVFAQPAWRWSSSNRSFEDASRSEPTSCHDTSTPVSAVSRRYSVGAVHHHPGQGRGRPELADEPRGMERRARGELRPVDEDDVPPAELHQVVGDRRPADATADDHCPRVLHGCERIGSQRPPAGRYAPADGRRHAAREGARVGPDQAGAPADRRGPDELELPASGQGDKQFFLRLPGPSTELLAVDRANELHNTRAAARPGSDRRSSSTTRRPAGSLLEWLPGRTMSNDAFQAPGMPARIAEALRRLHAGPRFRDDFNMFRLTEYYLRVVDERSHPHP